MHPKTRTHWPRLEPLTHATAAWLRRPLSHLLAAICLCTSAQAFDFQETTVGASCRYFDTALMLDWPGGTAGWFDAQGLTRGSRAYDTVGVDTHAGARVMRWNVTALFRQWASGAVPNEGLLITGQGNPGGGAQFHSRESAEVGLRPSLKVTHADGSTELLAPVADTVLDCSTYTGLGEQATLSIGPQTKALMRFDLSRLRKGKAAAAVAAELILVRTSATPWSAGALGVYRLATPFSAPAPAQSIGIAAAFARDRGLETHPEVLFAERFEGHRIDPRWTPGDPRVRYRLEPAVSGRRDTAVASGPAQPALSLRATVPKGQNLGLDLRYDFNRHQGKEPEEIYLRYYLKLDRSWLDTPDAGKLPGLAGTYGRAGWGGRAWDGYQGWSARGAFIKSPPAGHPMYGRLALGSYVYHSKSSNGYGDTITWGGGQGSALLEADRWYCVEQFLKLNTPQRENGVLRAWIDGRQVFERTDLRLRDNPRVKIEYAWMNVYVGGQQVALRDMSLNIANVVIAAKYIGPMAP